MGELLLPRQRVQKVHQQHREEHLADVVGGLEDAVVRRPPAGVGTELRSHLADANVVEPDIEQDVGVRVVAGEVGA
jgi:hypothetical protein